MAIGELNTHYHHEDLKEGEGMDDVDVDTDVCSLGV